jgi:CRP-like cAMP-binding protein
MLRKNAKVELLRRVPLFSECSKAQLSEIALLADEIDFPAGRVLIHEGNPGREFCVVIQGTVDVSRDGKKLAIRGGAEFFGEISLLSDTPTTATVATTSPVRALVITARSFRRLLENSPGIQQKVMRSMAARLAPDVL